VYKFTSAVQPIVQLIQETVRDSLKNQSSVEAPADEPVPVRKPRQVRIWLLAFGLIAFGLFCITAIPPRKAQPLPVPVQEVLKESVTSPRPTAAEPRESKLGAISPSPNTPAIEQELKTPASKVATTGLEPKGVESTQMVPREPDGVSTPPKQLTPTHTRREPSPKAEKSGAKAAHPKIAVKPKPEPATHTVQASVGAPSTQTASSSAQVSMGTSSGMPSQAVQSNVSSNKPDACYGTTGLAREQCQQCDSRSGWLFKLNCEAQVKTKFCSGREGKHLECPPSYSTPG
jgi:hypothetical protein